MGILDSIRNLLSGAPGGTATGPQAGGNPLVHHILQMLSDPSTGGLQGLVQQFHDRGLGSVVSSWVGTGANQSITPDQLTHALGAQRVQQMAQASGTPPAAMLSQLTTLLPTIIDKLTPSGTIPESGMLAQGMAMLRQTLGAAPAAPAAPTSTPTRNP